MPVVRTNACETVRSTICDIFVFDACGDGSVNAIALIKEQKLPWPLHLESQCDGARVIYVADAGQIIDWNDRSSLTAIDPSITRSERASRPHLRKKYLKDDTRAIRSWYPKSSAAKVHRDYLACAVACRIIARESEIRARGHKLQHSPCRVVNMIFGSKGEASLLEGGAIV